MAPHHQNHMSLRLCYALVRESKRPKYHQVATTRKLSAGIKFCFGFYAFLSSCKRKRLKK